MRGAPDWALDDEMVTMRPHCAAAMSGTASCMHVKVPVRLTARMRSHFSAVMSATASKDSIPALVTRIVTGPSSWRTSENTRSRPARSATSTSWDVACRPWPQSSVASLATAAPSRSSNATA